VHGKFEVTKLSARKFSACVLFLNSYILLGVPLVIVYFRHQTT